MLDSFLTFINQQKWNLASSKTLVAVSGGIDSVVLLQLFHNTGFRVGVAHCNFGLRGEESEEDEQFVKNLGQNYGFEVHVRHFDTKAFSEAHMVSTQMSARELRYAWFEEIRLKFGYDRIATAHHANDSLETTLLNLARGTGIAGLHGIPTQRNNVIRPLMFASRGEIKEYLDENKLTWREDRSNKSDDYKRNLIRHKVIPVLRELNPSLEKTFQTTSERLRGANILLDNFLNTWKLENTISKENELQIGMAGLLSTPDPVYCLWYILKDCGFDYQQVRQIYVSTERISGKVFHSSTHTVLKDRTAFIVRGSQQQTYEEWFIPGGSSILSVGDSTVEWDLLGNSDDFSFAKDSSTGYFAIEKLIFPLKIRTWQTGDSFCPFGMSGKKKKISDLLIDLKYSVFRKEKVKVLVNETGEIIWVMGIRTDDRFKVTSATKQILKVSFLFDKVL